MIRNNIYAAFEWLNENVKINEMPVEVQQLKWQQINGTGSVMMNTRPRIACSNRAEENGQKIILYLDYRGRESIGCFE